MGRSDEMGKPVEDLTPDELRTERLRCETLSAIYPPRTAKSLRKRLVRIEERIKELELAGHTDSIG